MIKSAIECIMLYAFLAIITGSWYIIVAVAVVVHDYGCEKCIVAKSEHSA